MLEKMNEMRKKHNGSMHIRKNGGTEMHLNAFHLNLNIEQERGDFRNESNSFI